MSVIEFSNVTKKFGDTVALSNLSIKLEENCIYGLLGRNGAGKTTLLNILTNRIFTTKGKALVQGEDVKENDEKLKQIYFMGEKTLFPEGMRIKQVLKWSKVFYPDMDIKRAQALCKVFGVNPRKKLKHLSTGYSTIVKTIAAITSNAPIVLLDEPVLGLDANHREMFYSELLKGFNKNKSTVIISTHLIEEAANVIEEVIVLHEGKVIVKDSVENLRASAYTISGPKDAVDEFIKDKKVLGDDVLGGLKTVYLQGKQDKRALPKGLEQGRISLQNLFIQLTNKSEVTNDEV